jgi:signal transduction histidine kinase
VQDLLKESHAERIRLGRDLHDGIIQSLFAIGLQIENLRKKIPTHEPQLALLRDSMNDTIADIRAFISGIEADHAQHDLVTEITKFVAEFQDPRIEVQLLENVQREVSKPIRQQLYYIVKEAVANAARHSHAAKILVQISLGIQYIQVMVRDNGCGFSISQASSGRGLCNMRERTEALGGKFVLTSTPQGTEISITLN